MKIATWNVERLKHHKSVEQILLACDELRADILVLTETDKRLRPRYHSYYDTPPLHKINPSLYRETENRVSICTNYPCIRQYPTFDENTSICVELETERGNLLIYGTIIGVYGKQHPSYRVDLMKQLADIRRLSTRCGNICICGDYNCSFGDSYYFTRDSRAAILDTFEKHNITLLTAGQKECIDHVAVSTDFIGNSQVEIKEWNFDKKLSDHKGIVINIK